MWKLYREVSKVYVQVPFWDWAIYAVVDLGLGELHVVRVACLVSHVAEVLPISRTELHASHSHVVEALCRMYNTSSRSQEVAGDGVAEVLDTPAPLFQMQITQLSEVCIYCQNRHFIKPLYRNFATSEMWCWSGGSWILTELSLCYSFDHVCCPLTSVLPDMRCGVGLEEGEYWKNRLCATVLCSIIMVHKVASSSYRLVDCIGLWSCLV